MGRNRIRCSTRASRITPSAAPWNTAKVLPSRAAAMTHTNRPARFASGGALSRGSALHCWRRRRCWHLLLPDRLPRSAPSGRRVRRRAHRLPVPNRRPVRFHPALPDCILGFLAGVGLEGPAVFDNRGQGREAGQCLNLDAVGGGGSGEIPQLALVGSRQSGPASRRNLNGDFRFRHLQNNTRPKTESNEMSAPTVRSQVRTNFTSTRLSPVAPESTSAPLAPGFRRQPARRLLEPPTPDS